MNEKISWKFPLRGITESCPEQPFTFSTKAREKLQSPLLIELVGLSHELLNTPDLNFQLTFENIPKEYEPNFSRIFKLLEIHSKTRNSLQY